MDYNQFKVLRYVIENDKVKSQREISNSRSVNLSLGMVNKSINSLFESGFIKNDCGYKATKKSLGVMEKYKVKSCVIFAAGFGSRMRPITLTTPKPLVNVNGTPMIESIINNAYNSGIRTFYIAVGYKNEMFRYLIDKYEDCKIELIINEEYDFYNNISSLYAARSIIGNSYICEADLVVKEETHIFNKYEYRNFYYGIESEGEINDWVYIQPSKHRVTDIKQGGKDNVRMLGISYFDEKTSKLISEKVSEVYNIKPDAKEWYWDFVPLRELEVDIYLRRINSEDVIEIDNIIELADVDSRYKKYLSK